MYFIQFGLYFFAFLLTESVINERAVFVIGSEQVNIIYAIGLLCTALGYCLYSFIYKHIKKELILELCVLSIISAFMVAYVELSVVYLISAVVCLISYGYLGGYVHFLVSEYNEKKHFTLHMGIVMALAIVLQCIVQSFSESRISFLVSIVLSSLFFALLKNKYEKNICEERKDIRHDENRIMGNVSWNIIICVGMVALMSMILGIEDSIMVYKNATGELQLFSSIRLFYALGLFVAGIIADIKERIFLPIATVCAVMLSTIAITFLNGDVLSYNISMGIMYFYSGFYVIYLTLMFVDMASRMRNSRLIAGLGRISRSITTSMVVIIITLLSNALSYIACNVINCVLSILVVAMFAFDEIHRTKTANVVNENSFQISNLNSKDKYESFCDKYLFTEKEKESFVLLISTEDTVQKIADDMGISRRVLQRHISSMYEKTETQTRVGLLMAYTKYLEEKNLAK